MIDSTFTFTKVLMKEAPQAKKIYVPNIIKMGVRYALQDSATEMFSKAGVVTFRVKMALRFSDYLRFMHKINIRKQQRQVRLMPYMR